MNLPFSDLVQMRRTLQPSIEIRVSNFLPPKEVQAKRHRRKSSRRWQKKWLKRFGTKTVAPDSDKAFQVGNVLYVPPQMMERVKAEMIRHQDEFTRNQFEKFWNGTI